MEVITTRKTQNHKLHTILIVILFIMELSTFQQIIVADGEEEDNKFSFMFIGDDNIGGADEAIEYAMQYSRGKQREFYGIR